jgi:hypothetical protein
MEYQVDFKPDSPFVVIRLISGSRSTIDFNILLNGGCIMVKNLFLLTQAPSCIEVRRRHGKKWGGKGTAGSCNLIVSSLSLLI